MMKLYPSQNRTLEEKVFGYWLSQARRIIENSFGIATAKFSIFRRPIHANVSTVKFVTKTVVGLRTDYILHGMPAVYFTWDSSSIIQLPVLGSIQTSVNAYLESNFLSDKNEFFSNICSSNNQALADQKISKVGNYLIIQVKCFLVFNEALTKDLSKPFSTPTLPVPVTLDDHKVVGHNKFNLIATINHR